MRSFFFGGMLAALLLGALAPTGSAQAPPGTVPFELQLAPARGAPRATTAWERDGVLYLAADEIALLLDATLYWRSELGRVTLTADKHEIAVTAGSDVAVIDATQTFHLPSTVFFWGGELMVPLDLVLDESGAPRPWIGKPVRFSRERRRLSAVEREGQVIGAEISSDALGWRLHITTDIDPRYEVVIAERSSVVIRLRGVSYDPLLLPLPTAHEAFQGLLLRNVPDGLEVSFTPTSAAQGYRVDVSGRRLSIVLGLDERDLREGRLRPLAAPVIAANELRIVALDPGHGGGERGAVLAEGAEADVALDLSQRIAARLRQELGADILSDPECRGEPVRGCSRAARHPRRGRHFHLGACARSQGRAGGLRGRRGSGRCPPRISDGVGVSLPQRGPEPVPGVEQAPGSLGDGRCRGRARRGTAGGLRRRDPRTHERGSTRDALGVGCRRRFAPLER